MLNDSANNINEEIGGYLEKRIYDSAKVKQQELGPVHASLIAIQSSINSLDKVKY